VSDPLNLHRLSDFVGLGQQCPGLLRSGVFGGGKFIDSAFNIPAFRSIN